MYSDENLLSFARAARLKAYAPYSGFLVGAALLTEDNRVVTGGNTENASYGMTVCAERVAAWTATHLGYRRFKKIAVVADCSPPPTPCGACRQVLWELAGDIEVLSGNLGGDSDTSTILKLLSHPFGGAAWSDNPAGEDSLQSEEMWRLPVQYNPIGYVVSDYHRLGKIPDHYKTALSKIVLSPEFRDGLYRLDEEDSIVVLSHLDQARGFKLKDHRSGRNNEVYGVFSCRTPFRPNSLAQSVVELVRVEDSVITVRGLDLLHGTPVIDIKTVYSPGTQS